MSFRSFRLPPGVDCWSSGSSVTISGKKGKVSFGCVTKICRKGDIVFFTPGLSKHESSILVKTVYGVVIGYSISLKLKGIGYRIEKTNDKLRFALGFSHPIELRIPRDVFISIKKKDFTLMSANYSLLRNFATQIRSHRFPDPYKGGGILYEEEKVLRKEGKKT